MYLEGPEGLGWVFLGVLGMVFAVPMTIGGAVVRSIGLRNKREYREWLDEVSLKPAPGGLVVSLDF